MAELAHADQIESPTPAERAESFAKIFHGNANGLAMAYGAPVYLVGSMLTGESPGDIDIRCTITREDLDALFGENADCLGSEWAPARFRRSREELKQSRRLTRRFLSNETRRARWGARFDFQFQVVLFSDIDGEPVGHEGKPRLRLDKVPRDYFGAGLGEP